MHHIRNVMLSLLCSVVLLSTQASAQECSGYDRNEYDAVSAQAESQLTELERLAARILEQGVMTDEDGRRNDELTNAYGSSMFSAYQLVHKAAEQAAVSEGHEGDARLTTEFELMASKHENRALALAVTWEKIHAAITQGDIREARLELPQGAPSPVKQLTQEGEQQLTHRHDMVRPDFLKIAARAEEEKHSLSGMCKAAASALGNFIIPTAEAAQIYKCVGPCAAKKWGDCLKCIGNAAPVVINAWNEFQGCWNSAGECKWSKPWNCAKKAWCLAKFIAVLA
jgi:hypothetical protein